MMPSCAGSVSPAATADDNEGGAVLPSSAPPALSRQLYPASSATSVLTLQPCPSSSALSHQLCPATSSAPPALSASSALPALPRQLCLPPYWFAHDGLSPFCSS